MRRFFKLLAVFLLPPFLLDSCINRDPLYYLDENSKLLAPWPGAPLSFQYSTKEEGSGNWYQLGNVEDFLMNDSLFIGKCNSGYFIVQRAGGQQSLFDKLEDRDRVLEIDYKTNVADLAPKPWNSRIVAILFFPINLIYYLFAVAIITTVSFPLWKTSRGKAPI